MTIVSRQQIRVIRYYPLVIQLSPSYWNSNSILPSPINWISILSLYCILTWTWIMIFALVINNARIFLVQFATWSMRHMFNNQLMKCRMFLGIWEFRHYESIIVVRACTFILRLKYYQHMSMWQAALLKFNYMDMSSHFSKYFFLK